jgi:hypothetical protein
VIPNDTASSEVKSSEVKNLGGFNVYT